MVRLADLKQRITPLTKTKPRLHQSYFDLHDLGRKSTVFDKLKRRFSQSDKDLSKLVQFDIHRDFRRQKEDDDLVVYNIMSSSDNDVDQRTSPNSESLRRYSATFDGFSDILDIIQGNVVDSNSKLLKEEKAIGCTKDRGLENVNGLIITNGHKGDKFYGECRDSFAYERYEKFGLNAGKNERPDVNVISRQSVDSDCSDDGKTFIDCISQQVSDGELSSSKSVPDLSQNPCAYDKKFALNEMYIDDNVVRDGTSNQRCEATYGMMQTGLESRKTGLVDSAGNTANSLKSVVTLPLESQSLTCKGMDRSPEPCTGHSVKEDENDPPSCSLCVTINGISEQNCDNSSFNGVLHKKRSSSLNTDSSFPMDYTVDRGQNSGVGDRLNLGNHEYHSIGYAEKKTGADVCCDSCRCTLDQSISEKSSCQHRLRSKINIAATEKLATSHTGQECERSYLGDCNMEMPLRRKALMECIGVGASRERSQSGGNVFENQNERKTRTRRLHSAPDLCPISEEEKARLEKAYESSKHNKHCTSLKSAMKKRSTDHNGNALRVRFDLSKSDEDLDKIRSDRDGFGAVHRRSVDIRAKPLKMDKDEQKKRWVYVMKKFRITNELADFDAFRNSFVVKDWKLHEEETENVKSDGNIESVQKKETELRLESVKEFSLFLPVRRMQVAADETKLIAMDQAVVEAASHTKVRYVKFCQISCDIQYGQL